MTLPRIAALAAAAWLIAAPAVAGDKTDMRCASYGEGFIYSESTGFCVRVSGSVEAGFGVSSKGSRSGSKTQLNFDARKDTELGPLRLFMAPKAGTLD